VKQSWLFRPGAAVAALALMGTLLIASSAPAQGWGTVKGNVYWAESELPPNPKANIDKDKEHCLSKGDIFQDKLVVNKKNKGVRWVLVWLADPADVKNVNFKPPIHPNLQKLPKTVEIDQPICMFEPRVVGLWADHQELVVKNSAPIPHNFAISSIGGGPSTNPLIPPKSQVTVKGFQPKLFPTTYSCSIHPWMSGRIGSFAHPYFAVTDADGNFEIKDAPAGKFRLMVWQEEAGWVIMKSAKDRGKPIEIKANGTTDVGKIPLRLPKD